MHHSFVHSLSIKIIFMNSTVRYSDFWSEKVVDKPTSASLSPMNLMNIWKSAKSVIRINNLFCQHQMDIFWDESTLVGLWQKNFEKIILACEIFGQFHRQLHYVTHREVSIHFSEIHEPSLQYCGTLENCRCRCTKNRVFTTYVT